MAVDRKREMTDYVQVVIPEVVDRLERDISMEGMSQVSIDATLLTHRLKAD